jgi:hypothetical protein
MILDQSTNEKTWWEQRQSLRNAIAQSIAPSSELPKLDAKIYKAQVEMCDHMSAQLYNLGIPFFGMPSALVVEDKDVSEGKLSTTQLKTLRTKMIDYLQSMYGPD